MKRIIVGITGASGTIYAVNLLQHLHRLPDVEVHLVMSAWAKQNLSLETDMKQSELEALADYVYPVQNQGATIASGSFLTDAMVIVPASMKTIAGIAMGFDDNLIGRAADVTIKEQRQLIIVPRETPLSPIHLDNLAKLAHIGVQIIPPIPAFYQHPQIIQDLIEHHTMKLLDALHIKTETASRWNGASLR